MKFYFLLGLLYSCHVSATGVIYQCKDAMGVIEYQETPCSGETIKIISDAEEKHTKLFTAAMKQTLAKLTQKTKAAYNHSEKQQAMEVLAMVDAAKSYAFTQIYAVSVKHCGTAVDDKLIEYKNQASAAIALGAYYYSQGIDANIDGKDFSQSGEELHAALNDMTADLEQQYQHANEQQLARKCSEASQALSSLTLLYSN